VLSSAPSSDTHIVKSLNSLFDWDLIQGCSHLQITLQSDSSASNGQHKMAGGDVRSLKRAINYAMSNIGMLMTAPAAAYAVVSVCSKAGKRGQMGSACTKARDG
jgi:hypothetical protein